MEGSGGAGGVCDVWFPPNQPVGCGPRCMPHLLDPPVNRSRPVPALLPAGCLLGEGSSRSRLGISSGFPSPEGPMSAGGRELFPVTSGAGPGPPLRFLRSGLAWTPGPPSLLRTLFLL